MHRAEAWKLGSGQGDIHHYGYDGAGRMNSGAGYASVSWDPYGEATALDAGAGGDLPSLGLGYDADGALLTKTVDGSAEWRYFGKLFVQTGASWRERIVADGEVVAIVNVSAAGFPSVDYRVSDNLGSTAAIVNASGELEGRYAWDAWGDLVNPASGNGADPYETADEALTTLGYTGHEMFWEAGLVHTQARLYDPSNGRWLSPDPTVPNLTDGQSLNRYSYVLNNPMTYTDPNGYRVNWYTISYAIGQFGEGLMATVATVALSELPPLAGISGIYAGNEFYGAYENFVSGSQGGAVQPEPLEALFSSDSTEAAVTAVSMVASPEDAVMELSKSMAEHQLRKYLGAMSYGGGGGGAQGTGSGLVGPGPGPTVQPPPVFRYWGPVSGAVYGCFAGACRGGPDSAAVYMDQRGTTIEVWNDGHVSLENGNGESIAESPDGSVTLTMANGTTVVIGNFAGGTIVWGLEAFAQ